MPKRYNFARQIGVVVRTIIVVYIVVARDRWFANGAFRDRSKRIGALEKLLRSPNVAQKVA